MTNPPDEPPESGGDNRAEPSGDRVPDYSSEPVPQVPRGKFFTKIVKVDLFRIGMFSAMLVMVIMMREPCSKGASDLINSLTPPIDAGRPQYQLIELNDEEIRKRFGGPLFDGGPAVADAVEANADDKVGDKNLK